MKPLAELIESILKLVPSGERGLRLELEGIKSSVEFVELPEMRREWAGRIRTALTFWCNPAKVEDWHFAIAKAWREFFDEEQRAMSEKYPRVIWIGTQPLKHEGLFRLVDRGPVRENRLKTGTGDPKFSPVELLKIAKA